MMIALALAFGLMPTGVFAGNLPTELWVAGDELVANPESVEGISYDAEHGILTLDGVTVRGRNLDAYIEANGDLIVELKGTNNIYGDDNYDTVGIDVDGTLTIQGSGTLNVYNVETGLSAQSVTIDLSTGLLLSTFDRAVAGTTTFVPAQTGVTVLLAGNDADDAVTITGDGLSTQKYLCIERYTVTPDVVDDFALLSGVGNYYFDLRMPDGAQLVSVTANGEPLEEGLGKDYTYYTYYGYSRLTLTDEACRSFRPADGAAGQTDLVFTIEKDGQSHELVAELKYPKTHALTICSDPVDVGVWQYDGWSTGDEVFYLPDGEPVTITACEDMLYEFVGWKVGDQIIDTEDSHTFTLTEDLEVTMVYELMDSPLTLSKQTLEFGSVPESKSDTPPAAQQVTMTNPSDMWMILGQVDTEAYEIEGLETDMVIKNGKSVTFTVRPKAGLEPGVYDEEITIYSYPFVQPMAAVAYDGEVAVPEEDEVGLVTTLQVSYEVTADATIPQTGDGATPMAWFAGALTAALCLFAVQRKRRTQG